MDQAMAKVPRWSVPVNCQMRETKSFGIALVLLLAIFGPYVLPGSGLRTEHLLLYPVMIVALFSHVCRRRVPVPLVWIILLFITYGLSSSLTSLISVQPTTAGLYEFAAGLDSIALPVANIVATIFLVRMSGDPKAFLVTMCKILLILLAINSAVITLQVVVDPFLGGTLRVFWQDANVTGRSTAEVAMSNSRFSGVFNQPAEAGAAYALGLVISSAMPFNNRYRFLVQLALLAGLASTGSKFFLLAAVVSILTIAITRCGVSESFTRLAILAGAYLTSLFMAWVLGVERQIVGSLTRVLQITDSGLGPSTALGALTSDRVGGDNNNFAAIAPVLESNPIFGFGISGREMAYDSFWVETLYRGGIFGLLLMTLILAASLIILRQGKATSWPVSLGIGFFLIVSIGSLGIGTLTANRISSLFWILFTSLALVILEGGRNTKSRPSRPRLVQFAVNQCPVDVRFSDRDSMSRKGICRSLRLK